MERRLLSAGPRRLTSASMRIVVAPDSFKGSVRASDAARAIEHGWRSVRPGDTFDLAAMADGGEGTVEVLAATPGARRLTTRVAGPIQNGGDVEADWLLLPGATGSGPVAVVELAAAAGITLLARLDPMRAHTWGFGQLIGAALDAGAERLLLAIGGSASTDGGAGALSALGARLLDAAGRPIPLGGGGLADLDFLDLRALRGLPPRGAVVLSDVTNPLLGASGAAAVFGPQKGADAAQVESLERGLARLAALLPGDPAAPGAGAAGGTGFGLLSWGATTGSGAAAVADAIGLDGLIATADLVITGEGSFDAQSAAGKVPTEVAARAALAGVPAALVAGRIAADTEAFVDAVALTDLAGGPSAAMADAVRWLEQAGAEFARRRAG